MSFQKYKYKYLGFALIVIMLNYLVTDFKGFTSSLNTILNIFRPIIIGMVIAYFIYPIVKLLNKYIFSKLIKIKKLSYYLSILTSYLILIILIYLLYSWLTPIIIDTISRITKIDYNTFVDGMINSWIDFQENIPFLANVELVDLIRPALNRFGQLFTNGDVIKYLNSLLSVTSSIYAYIMGIIVSIYMIISKEELFTVSDKFFYAIFSNRQYKYSKKYFLHFEEKFRHFFFGKMLDSLIIGILAYIGLLLLNIQFALLLAIVVMITNMIPYFGPFIGGIPVVIVTIFTSSDPLMVLWAALFILALQQFDGIYLGPKILGDSVGVSAVWIIISIIIGGALFGVIGLFLCVPVAATIKSAFNEFYEYRLGQKQNNKA